MALSELSVPQLRAWGRLRSTAVGAGGLLLALVAGPAIGLLDSQGLAAVVAVVVCMLLAMLLWRIPVSAVLMPAAAALVIEQFPLEFADRLTEHVLVFRSLNTTGLSGLFVTPSELLLATAVLIWLVRGMARRDLSLPRSALAAGLATLVLFIAAAAVHGMATGGQLRIVINEVRPFLYVPVLYLLASQLLRTRGQVWSLLWVVVLATGFKGIQGSYRSLLLAGLQPARESVLGHEEAVFFSIFILVTAGLWLFRIKGRLRLVATLLLPFVVNADLANQRRTAWVILPIGLVLLLVSAWVHCTAQRRRILAFGLVAAALSGLYLGVFWSSSSTAAQPARAIRSAFAPSTRDGNSDQYRVIENLDLGIDIRQSTPLGLGFGRPIPHPVPLPNDASDLDPLIDYVPHNGVLYEWLRTGIGGALALWFVIGAAAVVACRVVRVADHRLALMGAVGLCTIAAYVVEGWYDQGLMTYRVAFLVGCVLGSLEAARRIGASAA
ncbi:MAG: hypothetical protein QOG45_710 [Chloroflexota bacterium]|nr:hypothetical protein [Chloroflexota bacterium]